MMAESEVKLTIGSQNVHTTDVTKGKTVDIINRDPEHLHDEMRIHFNDVFGEPDDSVHSFDCVWTNAFRCFTNAKLWCYRITSLICGLPAAFCWGIYFALLSFCAIWCWAPYLKAYAINLGCVQKIFNALVNAIYRPCFEAAGYLFYNIRIQKVSG